MIIIFEFNGETTEIKTDNTPTASINIDKNLSITIHV